MLFRHFIEEVAKGTVALNCIEKRGETGGYAAVVASNGNTDLSLSGVMMSTPQVKLSVSSGIEPGITM